MGDVERTAKKRCPVDTGRLRASIHTSARNKGPNELVIETGTNVFYAPYVEFGHKIKTSRSFLTRRMSTSDLAAISKYSSAGSVEMGKVQGRYFLTTAWEMNKNRIPERIQESINNQLMQEVRKNKHIGAGSRGFYSGGGL
jgi:hypothetical protein